MKTPQQIEQELSLKPFAFQQKVEACKTLYLNCQGRHHDHIQQQMRTLGHERWNNRCLYARWSNGKYIPGWPERFGWKASSESSSSSLSSLRSSGSSKTSSISKNSTNSKNPTNSKNFLSWLKKLSGPYNWDWKFQRYVIEKLEAFERGDTNRLMLFVPPRHGKSELVTVRYAAWHLQNNPKSNIIIGSYNQRLANRFSRRIKNVYAEAMAIAEVPAAKGEPPTPVLPEEGWPKAGVEGVADGHTPDTTTATPTHDATKCDTCIAKAQKCPHANSSSSNSPNSTNSTNSTNSINSAPPRRANTDAEWETPDGGGVRAVGCGAGITGFGANLIIIDDPVKSRSEAESQTIRDKAFDWFNDDIYTRLEPDGKIILIQTRWHEDDLAGRLLREMKEDADAEQWQVINFPAIAEEPAAAAGDRGEPPTPLLPEEGWPKAGVEGVAGGPATPSINLSPAGKASQQQFADAAWNTTHIPPAHASRSDKKQLFYIRNGERIPIRTLGDPNKKRGDTAPAATPPLHKPEEGRHSRETLDTNVSEEHSSPANRAARAQSGSSLSTLNSQLSTDLLGRLPGEALCPERYPIKSLLQRKKRLGTYSFTALYQQRPIPAEGGFFKRHWFRIVDHLPAGLKWKRGYDLGISASPGADYTATARVAFDADGNMYIDRVLRRRMEYPEQRRAILALIADERDTEHFIEKSANGNAVIQDLRRERGISERHFRGVEVRESKTARAFTWNALAEEGRVHLIRSAWNTEFIDEACSFPGGVNDDQIDAVSIAVKMLREEKRRQAHGF